MGEMAIADSRRACERAGNLIRRTRKLRGLRRAQIGDVIFASTSDDALTRRCLKAIARAIVARRLRAKSEDAKKCATRTA